MASDLIGPTTALLEGNLRASTANKDRQSAQAMKSQELLASRANNTEEQRGATQRTEIAGKQAQFLEALKNQATLALETMKQKEEGKRKEAELKQKTEEAELNDYFTITPNVAKGLKENFGLDFNESVGKRLRTDVTIAMITASAKKQAAAINEGDGTEKPENLKKELRQLENSIKGNRDKLFTVSFKDIPTEAWGGEPGNFRKLAQNISGGKLGNLTPEQQSQVQMVAGYINTMKTQQTRANEINRKLQYGTIDYTGLGLGNDDGGGTGAPGTYKTADDVKAAYKAGKIKRDEATKILRDQFKMK